jgi:hypothetical protein
MLGKQEGWLENIYISKIFLTPKPIQNHPLLFSKQWICLKNLGD